jgi:hypothetical protein
MTATASLAQSTFTPPAVHTGNTLRGSIIAAPTDLSLSAAGGMLLLAKIPVKCKDVQVTIYSAQTGGTGGVAALNLGVRAGETTSNTISALGVSPALGSYIGPPYTPGYSAAQSEKFKYVTASLDSGTASVTMTLNYTISYSF